MDVAVMGFHLLAEIAQLKTCSCDSSTPAPFYNQFYSQYHKTQKTSKWRIGAANKVLHCHWLSQQLPGTQQDTGCMAFTADAPRNNIAPACHLMCS